MKTLLYNGKIWIGKKYFASSVGIDPETGKIIFVGKGNPDNKNIYNDVIDLKGKLVLPAFTDGHCHLFKGALVNSEVNLRYSSSPQEFKNEILLYRESLKKGEWIVGGYFSEANFKENFFINRSFIDSICNDVPVVLFRTDLHSIVCNTLALEKISIENHSGEFADREYIKDKNGIPTGELKEKAFYFAVHSLPEKSLSSKKEILKKQFHKLHSYGITSVTDMSWKEDLVIYKSMFEENSFNLKINSIIPFDEFEKINDYRREFNEYKNRIRFGGFKAFYDGSLSSQSALFFDNYKGTDSNGVRTDEITTGVFRESALRIDKAGYQIAVHVIGDLAVSETLDVVEEIIKVNGPRDRRVRLEHIQHVQNKDLDRFKKLDIVSSVQPAHLFFDAKIASDNLVHPETTHVFKKLVDKGNKICFGTDFPVVPEDPFYNIYTALTRKAIGFENGFNTDMCLDLVTCLEAYTINNAYACYQENTRGSIREGKVADLIILDRDLFSVNEEDIKDAKIEIMFIDGNQI